MKNNETKIISKNAKKLLFKLACSDALFCILNREFEHPLEIEEYAAIPLCGGIMQQGYQCGMLWGASLGAGLESFHRFDNDGEGIDFAPAMIKIARSKYIGIKFKITEAANLNIYTNNFFDIVTSSFVLHDMLQKDRISILKEMKRISDSCIIYDYGDKIPFIPSIFEFLEGNNYKNFLKDFFNELKVTFKHCEKINLKKGGALYICS